MYDRGNSKKFLRRKFLFNLYCISTRYPARQVGGGASQLVKYFIDLFHVSGHFVQFEGSLFCLCKINNFGGIG